MSRRAVLITATVLAAVGVVGVARATPTVEHDERSGDVCFWLRSGESDELTPSDWQRLGRFSSGGSLRLYVSAHCPEQLAKVTS